MKSLVCVFAHPDDEAMGPGGSIAKFASERDVFLICATKGNGTENENPEELGKVRQEELLNSAKILGIKRVELLGFDDGELNNNSYQQLAEKIEEKVREYQSDTLLTFETNGLTGHLDHIAVSLATSFVFKKLDFVKTLLYYCEAKDIAEEMSKDYFIYMPPGYSGEKVDLTVDIRDFLEQKKAAIKAHHSQKADGDRIMQLNEKMNKTAEYFLKIEK